MSKINIQKVRDVHPPSGTGKGDFRGFHHSKPLGRGRGLPPMIPRVPGEGGGFSNFWGDCLNRKSPGTVGTPSVPPQAVNFGGLRQFPLKMGCFGSTS